MIKPVAFSTLIIIKMMIDLSDHETIKKASVPNGWAAGGFELQLATQDLVVVMARCLFVGDLSWVYLSLQYCVLS